MRMGGGTFLLDLMMEKPVWREVSVSRCPPSKVKHSLCAYGGRKILMFSGSAAIRSRLRPTSDVFSLDLIADEPCWRSIIDSGMPGAGNDPRGIGQLPVACHMAFSLPDGRILIVGCDNLDGPCLNCHLFILDPTKDKPVWRMLGERGRPPGFGFGHSSCVVGGTRAIVLAGQTGEDTMVNDLYELCLTSTALS